MKFNSYTKTSIFCFLSLINQQNQNLICKETLLPYGNFNAIINFVKSYLPENPVILEAGAYCGKQSIIMSKFWPSSIIHSFEPVPKIYNKLKKNTVNYTNINCYDYALSDKTGEAAFYMSYEQKQPNFPSQSNSLLKPKDHLAYSTLMFKEKITVKTKTIDEWAKENNINNIDFFWLNMQGYALNTLIASPEMLKIVKVIAIEVEFMEIYENEYIFDDVKRWLTSQEFELAAVNFEPDLKYWFGDAIFIRKVKESPK